MKLLCSDYTYTPKLRCIPSEDEVVKCGVPIPELCRTVKALFGRFGENDRV